MTQKTEKELYEMLDHFHIHIGEEGKDLSNVYMKHSDIQALVDNIKDIIDRNSYHSKVKEFHETFDQIINNDPTFLSREKIVPRLAFKLEELTELAEACGIEVLGDFQRELFKKSQEVHYTCENKREYIIPNIVKALDALCDLQYFLSGTIVAMGLSRVIEAGFEEVHSSNMSKACISQEEATKTVEKYLKEKVNTTFVPRITNEKAIYLILREPDKKVLKSINYRPVNLEPILLDEFQ